MPLNSPRVGFYEARERLGAKQAAHLNIKDSRARTSSHKTARNKKTPTLFQFLVHMVSKLTTIDDHDEQEAGVTHLRAKFDRAGFHSSRTTLPLEMDYTSSTREIPWIQERNDQQERRTQERMNTVRNATEGECHDEVDSLASTLAEKEQPMREWPYQYYHSTRTMLMLLGVP